MVRSRVPEVMEKRSLHFMNKHKMGGWSQMRLNRLRRGAIKAFLGQVVEDLQKNLDQQEINGLVVAGPGEAKGQLMEMLLASWRARILGVLDVSMQTASGDLARLGDELAESDSSREKALAERLKKAVLKGQPAAYGPPRFMRLCWLAG